MYAAIPHPSIYALWSTDSTVGSILPPLYVRFRVHFSTVHHVLPPWQQCRGRHEVG